MYEWVYFLWTDSLNNRDIIKETNNSRRNHLKCNNVTSHQLLCYQLTFYITLLPIDILHYFVTNWYFTLLCYQLTFYITLLPIDILHYFVTNWYFTLLCYQLIFYITLLPIDILHYFVTNRYFTLLCYQLTFYITLLPIDILHYFVTNYPIFIRFDVFQIYFTVWIGYLNIDFLVMNNLNKIWSFDKFAITEVLDAFLNIFLFHFERYLMINNIHGKNFKQYFS